MNKRTTNNVKRISHAKDARKRGNLLNVVNYILGRKKEIAGLVRRHRTPFYIYDREALDSSIDSFLSSFKREIPSFKGYYAVKLNHHPFIVKRAVQKELGLDVLVDELDNPELKIRLRLEARKRGIPVIMATDNGDNIIFDIERYDLDKKLMLFNGAAGDLTLEKFKNFQPQDMPRLATQIAGPHVVVPRMLESVFEVGKSLYSWPQLGDAAALAGVSVAYVVKRLALGEQLKSGKLEVNLDSVFDPKYHSPDAVADRENRRKKILKNIGL
ncbi:MAG: hypothetical protein AAB602_02730 [Patescibacteria group bacterium]